MIVLDCGPTSWDGLCFRCGLTFHVREADGVVVTRPRFWVADGDHGGVQVSSEAAVVAAMPPEAAVEARVAGLKEWVRRASAWEERWVARHVVMNVWRA